jgi:hypothetical protein
LIRIYGDKYGGGQDKSRLQKHSKGAVTSHNERTRATTRSAPHHAAPARLWGHAMVGWAVRSTPGTKAPQSPNEYPAICVSGSPVIRSIFTLNTTLLHQTLKPYHLRPLVLHPTTNILQSCLQYQHSSSVLIGIVLNLTCPPVRHPRHPELEELGPLKSYNIKLLSSIKHNYVSATVRQVGSHN